MLNIYELERRWLKYKIKSYAPLILSVSAGLTLAVVLLVYLPFSDSKPKETKTALIEEQNTTQVKPILPVETPSKVSSNVELDVPENTKELPYNREEATLVLRPSLHFMDNIEEDISSYIEPEYAAPKVTKELASVPSEVEIDSKIQEKAPKKQKSQVVEEEKTMLTITKQEDESDLKDIIRRFKNNKNPALSLFISKRYYAAGEYQKSYNYALMTNEIDQNIDESWIVFSKSLVKLGQHELAINTLKAYLKTSKSTAAEVLLRNIESGAFR